MPVVISVAPVWRARGPRRLTRLSSSGSVSYCASRARDTRKLEAIQARRWIAIGADGQRVCAGFAQRVNARFAAAQARGENSAPAGSVTFHEICDMPCRARACGSTYAVSLSPRTVGVLRAGAFDVRGPCRGPAILDPVADPDREAVRGSSRWIGADAVRALRKRPRVAALLRAPHSRS